MKGFDGIMLGLIVGLWAMTLLLLYQVGKLMALLEILAK